MFHNIDVLFLFVLYCDIGTVVYIYIYIYI